MIVPPVSTGTNGTLISAFANARVSSQRPTPRAMATTATKTSLTTNSVAMTMATSATPTPIAAGRLRPARLVFSRASADVGSVSSDLKELGLFVLEQLVDDVDVLLGEAVETLLGAGGVVLADLGVLLGLVDRLLGRAAHAAHGDAALFGLGAGQLDELLAALLGELGKGDAQDLAVVGGVDAEVGLADGFLDGRLGAGVVGADDHEAWLRHLEA